MAFRLNDQETEQFILTRGLLTPERLAPFRIQCSVDSSCLFDIMIGEGVITPAMLQELEKNAPPPPPPPPRSIRAGGTGFLAPRTSTPSAPAVSSPPAAPPVSYHSAPTLPSVPAVTSAPALPPVPPPSPASKISAAVSNFMAASAGMASTSSGTSPAVTQGTAGLSGSNQSVTGSGPRRPSRTRLFEDGAVSKPAATSSQARAAVAMPSASSLAAVAAPPPPPPAPPVQQQVIQVIDSVRPHPSGPPPKPLRPHGWPGGTAPADPSPGHIQQWLKQARASGASDLFFSAGSPPMMSVNGKLSALEGQPVSSREQTAGLARQVLTREQWDYVERCGDLPTGYSFPGGGRYRICVARHFNGYEIAARIIGDRVPSVEQLGLPENVKKLTQFNEGLIVFSGTANTGKTTTMMAVIEMINRSRSGHIVTLEDPIEYLLAPQSCQITQREVGLHTADYDSALHSALHEDPDVIVMGELSSHKTVLCAMALAEAGHLVLATVQAADCARTIDRMLECPEEPLQLRSMIADSVRAIFSQQLIERADGQGRVAACEMLINSISVANIIRDAKTQNLVNVMQTGKAQGMLMMDESLRMLVEDGMISGEEGYARCKNKAAFKQYLAQPDEVEEAPPEPQKLATGPQKIPPQQPRR